MAANATGEAQVGPLRLQFDRSVKLAFRGSSISSDGGLLLHRELHDALGLTDMAAAPIADPRTGRNGRHRLAGFLRQSIFSRIAGYEDVNDADRLRLDPVMRQLVAGRAVKHGAAEQFIKEGKYALKWTRLSCLRFAADAVRLQLHALAYDLANFLRTLATPEVIETWSLTSLGERLIKTGTRPVRHARYAVFRLAEAALPREVFAGVLELINGLRGPPPAAVSA